MPNSDHHTAKLAGRPRIETFWVEEIAHLMFNEGIDSPTKIFRHLEALGEQREIKDYPAQRTVARYMNRLRKDRDDRDTALFRWPASMGSGEHQLPWEAAGAVLELLRWCLEKGYRRPTVKSALWYWRVYQSGIDASRLDVRHLSGHQSLDTKNPEDSNLQKDDKIRLRLNRASRLSIADISEHQGIDADDMWRNVELELAFRPELSEDNNRAFEQTIEKLENPAPEPSWDNRSIRWGDREVPYQIFSKALERHAQRLDDKNEGTEE